MDIENQTQPVIDRSRGKWYIVQVRTSFEHRVQSTLEAKIRTAQGDCPIYEAVVPEHKFLDTKKQKQVSRLIYPGYVYVRMDLYKPSAITGEEAIDESAWYFVREITGVTRFIGNPEHPSPLTAAEVRDLYKIMDNYTQDISSVAPPNWLVVGARVRVDDPECPFNELEGRIVEIDSDRAKVKLMITIFERDTPVELEFKQVEQIGE